MLELDDGTALCETWAICEYVEEKHPQPALIGSKERVMTRMWWRRAEIHVCWPMTQGSARPKATKLFKERTYCVREAGDDIKEKARRGIVWLDGLMDERRRWLAGDRITMADICLYAYIDLLRGVGRGIAAQCRWMPAWFNRAGARPAATQSVWREQR